MYRKIGKVFVCGFVAATVFCGGAVSAVLGAEAKTADSFCYPVGAGCVVPGDYHNSQEFGELNYVMGGYHLGEDWNGPGGGNTDYGDPVYAVANGLVMFAADIGGGWGKVVIVRHVLPSGKSVNSLYAHLSKISVLAGSVVEQRGKVGEIGDADGKYVDAAHLHFEIRVSSAMQEKVGSGYSYNQNTIALYTNPTEFIAARLPPAFAFESNKICSAVTGGAETGWNYSCATHKPEFPGGETAYVLSTLRHVWLDHRFSVRAYKNGAFQWDYTTDWNHVDSQWGWDRAQFWPALFNADPGNWAFDLSVELSNNTVHSLGKVSFVVLQNQNNKSPYQVAGVQTCNSIGGPDSNWNYWCKGENDVFAQGSHVYALLKLTDIYVDHRFCVVAIKGGVAQWQYTTGWNNVNESTGWKHAYFWPALSYATPGFWEFDLYVGTSAGFSYVGQVNFVVR